MAKRARKRSVKTRELALEVEPNPIVTITAGQIQFVDACPPPLTAGDYEVVVNQNVKVAACPPPLSKGDYVVDQNQNVKTVGYERKFGFTVDAPRFSLQPTDIHSVYPPPGISGPFETTLPHVVLTRRTLPWERTIDGAAFVASKENPVRLPWMAVLLFTQNELDHPALTQSEKDQRAITPATIPVSDSEGAQDGLCLPQFNSKLKPWETKASDGSNPPKCLVIDLPLALFHAVVPSKKDLAYLAHARQIDTSTKEITAVDDRGWFSLIIGNRLPQADRYHRAFLVSLEGHQGALAQKAIGFEDDQAGRAGFVDVSE